MAVDGGKLDTSVDGYGPILLGRGQQRRYPISLRRRPRVTRSTCYRRGGVGAVLEQIIKGGVGAVHHMLTGWVGSGLGSSWVGRVLSSQM